MNTEQHINTEEKKGRIRVGITHGDLNGIGYEVILKTLADQRINELCTPIIYGSSKLASYHRKTLKLSDFNINNIRRADQAHHRKTNLINVYEQEVKVELGKPTEIAGKLAYYALEKATEDLMHNEIEMLVTAPINKHNIQSENFNFPGHTEYLAEKFNAEEHLMIMVSNEFRIGTVTGHLPLNQVSSTISKELLKSKLDIFEKSLIQDFGISKPKIAVLSINPHAGDNGVIGNEESEIIEPVIKEKFDGGSLVYGPYPADGLFGSSMYKKFDGILAMYHDQGLVPFKVLAMDDGVNFTAGLPIVRTSPAHGTAFDIAGTDSASEGSFRAALYLAIDIYHKRLEYLSISSNPLPYYLAAEDAEKRKNKYRDQKNNQAEKPV